MFSNSSTPDFGFDEATVVQVDPQRKYCKIKTLRGQSLDQVQWTESVGNSSRGGDRVGPHMGDRVVVMFGLGYPLIFGFLPKPQSVDSAFPINISGNKTLIDTGDYSAIGDVIVGDANKPMDILNGDRTMSSEGGAFFALLRGGAVLLKSSSLAQIFISKLDDVVKIVSRNFEHYTDVGSDIVKNFKGRVYRYVGYTNSFTESKAEDYRYHQYFGDTAAAEAVKTSYSSPPLTVPAVNDVLFKEQITDTGVEKMYRTLNLAGEEEVKIVGAGGFTKVSQTGGVVTLNYNDQNTITINNDVIELQRSDGSTVIMNASGIQMNYSGGKVEMKSSGVFTTFSGHFVNVTSGGVQLG